MPSIKKRDEAFKKISDTFGKNLSLKLDNSGFLDKEVAAALGISPTSVSLWKIGKTIPSIVNFVKLCALLKCEYSDLLPPIPKVDIQEKTIKVIKAKVATFRI